MVFLPDALRRMNGQEGVHQLRLVTSRSGGEKEPAVALRVAAMQTMGCFFFFSLEAGRNGHRILWREVVPKGVFRGEKTMCTQRVFESSKLSERITTA